jgi:DNA polymerase-3 subunit chi
MKQFSFYQVMDGLLEKTICQLSEKSYHGNHRVAILSPDLEVQESINKTLWTYSQKQFIPHGSSNDPKPERQPIYLTNEIENPNKATILMMINPSSDKIADLEKLIVKNTLKSEFEKFERCMIIFTLSNDSIPTQLHDFQKYLAGNNINYEFFAQTSSGGWAKRTIE